MSSNVVKLAFMERFRVADIAVRDAGLIIAAGAAAGVGVGAIVCSHSERAEERCESKYEDLHSENTWEE